MVNINNARGLRSVAQMVAAFLLVAAGVVAFPFIIPALFSAGGLADLATVAVAVVLVPLGLLSLFRPRAAGCLVVTGWLVVVYNLLSHAPLGEKPDDFGLKLLFLYFTLPPAAVGGLLFYASSGENPGLPSGKRRHWGIFRILGG
jgi:hypothetical protein